MSINRKEELVNELFENVYRINLVEAVHVRPRATVQWKNLQKEKDELLLELKEMCDESDINRGLEIINSLITNIASIKKIKRSYKRYKRTNAWKNLQKERDELLLEIETLYEICLHMYWSWLIW